MYQYGLQGKMNDPENDLMSFQPKKKKDKHHLKPILAATETAYGTLNVMVSGYDMTLVERYSKYIHNLCNRLGISVAERWVFEIQIYIYSFQ